MKKILIAISALALAWGGIAPSSARNISLDDAVNLVLTESQDIKKAAANVERMEAALSGVHSRRLVQVDAAANYIRQPNLGDWSPYPGANISNVNTGTGGAKPIIESIATAGLTAAQPLYSFGKIGYAIDMARRGVEIAKTSRRLAEIEMRVAANNLYWSAKYADELVKIADKSLAETKSARTKLTATGRANRSNLVKISADVAARGIELADAKFRRDSAHRMLKAYAGLDDAEPITLTTGFPGRFETMDRGTPNPPEWEIHDATARLYDAEKRKNYANMLPTISAFGQYDYNTFAGTMGQKFDLTDLYQHSVQFGVNIRLSIFDWGIARHAATESAMQAESARLDLDKSKKLKTAEYDDLLEKHAHLRRQLTDAMAANELAEKAYKLSRDRFLAGQTSATELSDVERSLATMETNIIGIKLQILAAEAEKERFL
ncbi:MAG: TolC family protein [Rickettsiales bacterium]|jgi:outer membrane protein TolC|nr:TolC family protein [Rickettsiales bacterium]